jgi:hypothetical protein
MVQPGPCVNPNGQIDRIQGAKQKTQREKLTRLFSRQVHSIYITPWLST